ncbi:MAG TPA: ImmA/IrrE family metallo-endopeptidase [Aquella sp.]|nr:ImmA/IrrE family metallo-endopeptidase [Aquella sp.]
MMICADYKRAESEAQKLLESLGYTKPPVDPLEIAIELNIPVKFVNFSDEYNNISGFYYYKDNSIYVNKTERPNRQTFTIAHELGHKILHEEWIKSDNYQVLFREQLAIPSKDPKEQEANCFAANLLVPKEMLIMYKDIASIDELSTLFMVSKPVIRNRLNTLCL